MALPFGPMELIICALVLLLPLLVIGIVVAIVISRKRTPQATQVCPGCGTPLASPGAPCPRCGQK